MWKEHGSQGRPREDKPCSGWPPHPASGFLNSAWIPLPSYTSSTSEQTQANLTAKIQTTILVIDISAQRLMDNSLVLQSSHPNDPALWLLEPCTLSHGDSVSCVDGSRRAETDLAFSPNIPSWACSATAQINPSNTVAWTVEHLQALITLSTISRNKFDQQS